jgi:hypothetical protein
LGRGGGTHHNINSENKKVITEGANKIIAWARAGPQAPLTASNSNQNNHKPSRAPCGKRSGEFENGMTEPLTKRTHWAAEAASHLKRPGRTRLWEYRLQE